MLTHYYTSSEFQPIRLQYLWAIWCDIAHFRQKNITPLPFFVFECKQTRCCLLEMSLLRHIMTFSYLWKTLIFLSLFGKELDSEWCTCIWFVTSQFIIFEKETFHKDSTLFPYTFTASNFCKGRLLHICMQLLPIKTMKNKYFRCNKQIHFFLGNISPLAISLALWLHKSQYCTERRVLFN